MAKTVGRLKDGDLLIAGEINERQLPIKNGLIAHFPMDGNLNDNTVRFKASFKTEDRDTYGPAFPSRYDYRGMRFIVSGRVRCLKAVDWNTTTSAGFRYISKESPLTYTWVNADSWVLSTIREWHDFSAIYTVPTDTIVKDLMPFIQINMQWVDGYEVEYEGLNYTLISPVVTSNNNTLTDDGLCVEEATTNLITNGDFSNGLANWSLMYDNVGGTTPYVTTFQGKTCLYQDVTTYNMNRYYAYNVNVEANVTYTVSFLIFNIKGKPHFDPNGPWNTGYYVESEIGKWVKHSYTFTPTTSGTEVFHFYGLPERSQYYVTDLQLEKKTFATSFTHGTRGEGEFEIDNMLNPKKGTVVVDVTFFEDDTVNGLQGADQYCFGNQTVYNVANAWWFHDTKTWFIKDLNGVRHDAVLTSPVVRNERTHLVFVYDDSDGTMDIYKNGELATNGAKKTAMIGLLGSLNKNWTHSGYNQGTTYKMCQKIHNLAFYNRALTADEAMKLYRSSFSISKEGHVVSSIKEDPFLYRDGIHFPLRIDGKDRYGVISPDRQVNIHYTPEGAYISGEATNFLPNPSAESIVGKIATAGWDTTLHTDAIEIVGWNTGYNSGVANANIGHHAKWVHEGMDGGACIKFMDLNSKFTNTISGLPLTHRWLGISTHHSLGALSSLGIAVGDSITVSFWMKVDTPGKVVRAGIYHYNTSNAETFGSATHDFTVDKINVWTRVSATFVIDNDWNLTSNYNYLYIYGHYGEEGIAWVDNMQVEKSTFPSRFSDGTRVASRLTYKFDDIFPTRNVDDFTIILWAKLDTIGGVHHLIGAWPYFYFGFGSGGATIFSWQENSVNTGNVNTQRNVTGGPSATIGKWAMIAVTVRIGVGIDIYFDGKPVKNFATPFSLTGTSTEFGLHGYSYASATYVLNGVMKDVMIYNKRALSADEISAIYKTQMRAYKNNSLRIQGKVIEGQVLD